LRLIVVVWILSTIVSMVLGFAVRHATSQPEVIEAKAFRVVDQDRRPRVEIGITALGAQGQLLMPGTAAIRLLDEQGSVSVALGIWPAGGPGLEIRDPARRRSIGLMVGIGPTLLLSEGNQTLQAHVGAAGPRLFLNGADASTLIDPAVVGLTKRAKKAFVVLTEQGEFVVTDHQGRTLLRLR
jgi:hypothetical protein